jgi:hypothetical protein
LAACWHVPTASHASVVQGFGSSGHASPEFFGTIVQVEPLHVELVSHGPGVHVNAVPPQDPFVHLSFFVHAVASSQTVLSALFDHALVEVVGVQTWQSFVGLLVPAS